MDFCNTWSMMPPCKLGMSFYMAIVVTCQSLLGINYILQYSTQMWFTCDLFFQFCNYLMSVGFSRLKRWQWSWEKRAWVRPRSGMCNKRWYGFFTETSFGPFSFIWPTIGQDLLSCSNRTQHPVHIISLSFSCSVKNMLFKGWSTVVENLYILCCSRKWV